MFIIYISPNYHLKHRLRHGGFLRNLSCSMSKTGRRSSPQTGKRETKELRASQGRKTHNAVNSAPAKGMEKTDQAERRSCLAER